VVTAIVEPASRADSRSLAGVLRAHAEPLTALDDPDTYAAIDRFADSKVVMLGESTHGTAEFYRIRAAITRRLIERHGFRIVALEADWPDVAQIDRTIRNLSHVRQEPAFMRFPTWMWRNAEFARFTNWLKGHNARQPQSQRVELRGLDIYSLSTSIAAVVHFLDHVDPKAARAARQRYGCLTPWQSEPTDYARAVLQGEDPCEDKVTEQLQELLKKRLNYIRTDGSAFFDVLQNARIVQAAEEYYRTMYRGSRESWNLRDRHMFETLQTLLAARPDAKAVVWAHNSHVGSAAATAMGWQGEFNIGELARNAYQERVVLIGLATDRGTVAAASDWGTEMEIKRVLPARADSIEAAFREAGLPCAFTEWRSRPHSELVEALSTARLERAIGVVYRPDTEFLSHYFQAVLSAQFDGFIWIEQTQAVTPLLGPTTRVADHEPSETYPSGL
jgi:erythromycin esterase-like protein